MFKLLQVEGLDIALNAMQHPVGKYGNANFDGKNLFGAEDSQVKRAENLTKQPTNSGHPNFLSGIMVWVQITEGHAFWMQWQRYHFQQIISSESKMYTVAKGFIDDKVSDRVSDITIRVCNDLIGLYNAFDDMPQNAIESELNNLEIPCEVPKNKAEMFEILVDNIPMGYQLTADVVLNYLQLRNMYEQRKKHKMSYWNTDFVKFVETLPYSEWILGGKEKLL